MSPNVPNENQPQQPVVDLETPEQKYARLYTNPATPQPPVATPSPAPVAPMIIPQELTDTLQRLSQEVQELRQSRPASSPVPPVPAVGWVEKIRQGDFEGAEQVLTANVRQSIEKEVKSKAYEDALAATQVQLEIDRHIQKVRMENPEIARFERYLQAPVNSRVEAARAAGRIKSSEDFIREYKAAVDNEVTELRNLGLQYRADGKTEALTRTTQVMGAFTPAPQQVGEHAPGIAPPSQQGESTQDYFARRQATTARLKGLSQ
jgi:hypothetical protein